MYIYVTTNIINGKRYVGKCHRDPNKSKDYLGSGVLLNQSINKHGKEFFKKTIIEENLTIENINDREKYWIESLNTKPPYGYNLTDGGDGLTNPSEEVRRRIGLKNSGVNSGRYGSTNTEEHKEVVRRCNIERGQSIESRDKIREHNLGKKLSEETKNKIRAYQLGRKKSAETKEKMKKNNFKNINIEQYSLDGKLVCVFNSITDACNSTKISVYKIRKCLNGKMDSINGYKWKKVIKEEI